jgi:exodeoxyribonuclease VII large subunit
MCHTSTKTPTKSAEFIIAHNRAFEDSLTQSMNQVIVKTQQILGEQFNRTNALYFIVSNSVNNLIRLHKDTLSKAYRILTQNTLSSLQQQHQSVAGLISRIASRPLIQVKDAQSNLNNLISNLQAFSKKLLSNHNGYLGHFVSVINLMSPKSIMKRGFAVITYKNKIVKNAEEIEAESQIVIHFSAHELESTVTSKTKTDGSKFEV